jgi:hypothetical protein
MSLVDGGGSGPAAGSAITAPSSLATALLNSSWGYFQCCAQQAPGPVLISCTKSMLPYECCWHALPCTLARIRETVSSNASGRVAERPLINEINERVERKNVLVLGRLCMCWIGPRFVMSHVTCDKAVRPRSTVVDLLSLLRISLQDTHCHAEYAAPPVTKGKSGTQP